MSRQQELISSLPQHLRAFAQIQDYARYSPRDHAVWRFTLRRLATQLKHTAHPIYQEGLRRTGISLDDIPNIEDMHAALSDLGWSAVVVDGFIPPAIFMEFQALRILVIAQDMRPVEHILYTPAPDIVHESAGHAPFIIDTDYAEYLQRFGEIGMKAIASVQDLAVYQAIRHLSIIKQNALASTTAIQAAEAGLQAAIAANTQDSEATRLARLHWWTVEYGLVGDLDNYRLFGAGLLSSLGESLHCVDNTRVSKQALTVDVVDCAYDITSEQPQLFVTRSCKHMSQILEEFAESMCFMRGGAPSLKTAIDSGAVCTAQYSSGLQVSGRINTLLTDAVGHEIYLRTSGPTQLAYAGKQLAGHGISSHAQGFGSPVGKLKELPQCLSTYSVDELKNAGISLNQACRLEFLSGITVSGTLIQIGRQNHLNVLLSFDQCSVTDRHGACLFDPAWGRYDMAVGARITSVYGGVADRSEYQLYAASPIESSPSVPADPQLMRLYQQLRDLRNTNAMSIEAVEDIHRALLVYPDEWLIRIELLEVLNANIFSPIAGIKNTSRTTLSKVLRDELQSIGNRNPGTQELINLGLKN